MKSINKLLAIFSPARDWVALFALTAMWASTLSSFPNGALAQRPQTGQALSEEQRILHVLNRLGFGARPGDLERVKTKGLNDYINQQLNPEKISDEVAEAKVKNLATLSMTTAELYERFPQPGQLLRQLQRRGDLPADLAEAQKNRVKGTGQPIPSNTAPVTPNDAMTEQPQTKTQAAVKNTPSNVPPQDNEEYRKAIREYYLQNGLQPPARITAELQASRILRAVYSERQLQEVMVDFWTNHFNVFAGKGADRWLLVSYDRDTIRPHSMGKFSDLLVATAQSPAMLFYLDNFQSVSPNTQARSQLGLRPGGQRDPLLQLLRRERRRDSLMGQYPNQQRSQPQPGVALPPTATNGGQRPKRGINENYARELMELHTLGVDGGYTQKDVQEVARCFTGWTIFAPRGGAAVMGAAAGDAARENAGKFYFNSRMHDDGEKVVLGHKIPAGGGMKDGLTVLDILAHQPATARFIATKLVRHFVSDASPSGLVDRVAAAFAKSDGDIRETLRAIFSSPEFNSPETYRAKVKRPFELAISAIRTLGGDTNGGPQLHQWIARMGEPLYGYQTPNGYSDSAESWVNTGGLLERLNFGLTLASNRIPGTHVELKRFLGATGPTLADKQGTMDRFLNVIIGGDVSAKTKETLMRQLNEKTVVTAPVAEPSAAGGKLIDGGARRPMERPDPNSMNDDATEATAAQVQPRRRELARLDANVTDPLTRIVGLILGSPEFQRQ